MPVFGSKTFRRSTIPQNGSPVEKIGHYYRSNVNRHPFLLFGLPFLTIMVASSFILTPATALRYEKHDLKNRQMSQNEAMRLGLRTSDGQEHFNPRRRVVQKGNEAEEYYRLMAKDIDNWEQKRVERFPGEPDGRL